MSNKVYKTNTYVTTKKLLRFLTNDCKMSENDAIQYIKDTTNTINPIETIIFV